MGEFEVKVRDKFSCAHQLLGYEGDCARLHGHTFRVEVSLLYGELGGMNMAVDFREVKEALKPLIGHVDHQYLNEVLMECAHAPTAEYLAQWFFYMLSNQKFPVVSVTIWESDTAGVTFHG